MTDFRSAAAALDALRTAGIAVSPGRNGQMTLSPPDRVTDQHRRIIAQTGPALGALLALRKATALATRQHAGDHAVQP